MSGDDPYGLSRFITAQRDAYDDALAEIRAGRKQSHWMWFVFPQIAGLGFSEMSRHFAIRDRAEAEAYLAHAILGPRLLECARAVLEVTGRSAQQIFGDVDATKLRSSATLFAAVSPEGSVFHQVLGRYFDAHPDQATLTLLR